MSDAHYDSAAGSRIQHVTGLGDEFCAELNAEVNDIHHITGLICNTTWTNDKRIDVLLSCDRF